MSREQDNCIHKIHKKDAVKTYVAIFEKVILCHKLLCLHILISILIFAFHFFPTSIIKSLVFGHIFFCTTYRISYTFFEVKSICSFLDFSVILFILSDKGFKILRFIILKFLEEEKKKIWFLPF